MSLPVIPPLALYLSALLFVTNLITGVLWRSAVHEVQVLELQGEIAQANNERKVEAQQQITKETTDGWKAAVDYLRARPGSVLSRACAGAMPGISGAAAGADGPGQGPILTPARIEEDVAEDVLKMNRLQDWVEKQKRVK